MKYIITEGKTDEHLISNLFKTEISKNGWIISPIGGGQSEAISLAISLAYRYREDGRILLILNSGGEMNDENENIKRIKSLISDYENIDIVFSVPEIEAEIVQICNLDNIMPELSKWIPIYPKEAIRKKAVEVMKKKEFKPITTSFYTSIKELLEPQISKKTATKKISKSAYAPSEKKLHRRKCSP